MKLSKNRWLDIKEESVLICLIIFYCALYFDNGKHLHDAYFVSLTLIILGLTTFFVVTGIISRHLDAYLQKKEQ